MQRGCSVADELLDILDLAQAFVRDLDGTIRFWSTGASRLYQWTAEEVLGRVSHAVLQTRFPQPLQEIQRVLLREGSWRGELTHKARDGRQVYVVSHWALYRNALTGTVEVAEINHDISELKEAHRELARLRQANEEQLYELKKFYHTAERLSAIVESSNDAIISQSLDGLITSWNAGAEKMFGFTADEMLGKTLSVFTEPELSPFTKDAIESVEEKTQVYETVGRKKDGRSIDLSITISPLYDAHGRMAGTSNIARDITDKKRFERRLLDTNEELRQFAYAAAHDLQEPIRNISLYAQLVRSRSMGLLDTPSQEGLRTILNSANRMRALAEDLLAYTRATTGPDVVEPTDSRLALESVLEDFRQEIDDAGAVISVVGEMPVVLMHFAHLVQIFENLIDNALKYRAGDPKIEVCAEESSGMCTFSIHDNGIGIDRQHWSRIFGVFKRLHGPSIPGTGIGLAVCQRIVSHYGGRIWVESVLNQGSTFFFTAAVAR